MHIDVLSDYLHDALQSDTEAGPCLPDLPEDLWRVIFGAMPPIELAATCMLVCKDWYAISRGITFTTFSPHPESKRERLRKCQVDPFELKQLNRLHECPNEVNLELPAVICWYDL